MSDDNKMLFMMILSIVLLGIGAAYGIITFFVITLGALTGIGRLNGKWHFFRLEIMAANWLIILVTGGALYLLFS